MSYQLSLKTDDYSIDSRVDSRLIYKSINPSSFYKKNFYKKQIKRAVLILFLLPYQTFAFVFQSGLLWFAANALILD